MVEVPLSDVIAALPLFVTSKVRVDGSVVLIGDWEAAWTDWPLKSTLPVKATLGVFCCAS